MSARTCYIVHSIGVREGRDLLVSRWKDGRPHRRVEILHHKGDAAHCGKPRWIDEALVFETEERARAAYLWARVHRERHSSNQTIANVLISTDYIASLANAKPAGGQL